MHHPPLREIQQVGDATREWLVTPADPPVISPHVLGTGVPALADHGLGIVGWSQATEGFLFVRQNPPFGHMLATLEGEGRVYTADGWQTAGPGSVYLSPPRALSAYHARAGSEWRIVWAHTSDQHFVYSGDSSYLTVGDASALYLALRGLWAESTGPAEDEPLSHWVRLVATAVRRLVGPQPDATRLRALWRAVESDPRYPWSLEMLAHNAGMSAEHLRRLCRQETGHSPMAQVALLRMHHAQALLSSGRYTVADVAERVGYGNAFAFSTAFKRVTGRTPSQART